MSFKTIKDCLYCDNTEYYVVFDTKNSLYIHPVSSYTRWSKKCSLVRGPISAHTRKQELIALVDDILDPGSSRTYSDKEIEYAENFDPDHIVITKALVTVKNPELITKNNTN